MEGKGSIELFREGGEGAGIERVLARHDHLPTARALDKIRLLDNPSNTCASEQSPPITRSALSHSACASNSANTYSPMRSNAQTWAIEEF